jgi:2-polyprenyl-6-methoxyphenol hydroxylase-like FAD-dependent oxidoreductase
MFLALMLARRQVPVVLLEAHLDFDRDFRGDTIHPSTLELLDQLGLAERVHALPHGIMRAASIHSRAGVYRMASFDRLPTRYPYILLVHQALLLDLLAQEVRSHPSAEVVMGANVPKLLHAGGKVEGVAYRGPDGAEHEVRALLTVGADGRFSKVRKLAGLVPVKTSPPMDVVWLRLPRAPGEAHEAGMFYVGDGRMAVVFARAEAWQVGFVIPKGGYQQLRARGIEALRAEVAGLVPWLADRVNHLHSWADATLLAVESSRVPRWYRPGLLLIGDAAHVMSPVGGVGISYAVQDAVAAANLLAGPLRDGTLRTSHLAAVQRRREWPTRVIQAFQRFMQRNLVATALDRARPFRLPLALRLLSGLPWLRDLPARLIAFGVRRERLRQGR